MSDDRELDELLGVVNEPLEMRNEREDTLLAELLQEIARDTGAVPAGQPEGDHVPPPTDPAHEVIALTPVEGSPVRRPSHQRSASRWAFMVGRAAVIALLVGGLVFLLARSGSETNLADQPEEVRISEPTPIPSPRYATVEQACQAFADEAPDRLDLLRATGLESDDTAALLEAFDTLIDELSRRSDLAEDTMVGLRLIRGRFAQANAEALAGQPGLGSFSAGEESLGLLQSEDSRFETCWQF